MRKDSDDNDRRPLESFFRQVEEEPTQFTCVVEGRRDRLVINRVFRAHGVTTAVAIQVDRLDVSGRLFPGGTVAGGNRARVMRVAELAEERLGMTNSGIVCVADLDLELLAPIERTSNLLELTSGPSLDSLYMTVDVLDCILHQFAELDGVDPTQVLDDILAAGRASFAARFADSVVRPGFAAIRPGKLCSVRDGRLVLDADRLVTSYGDRPGFASYRSAFGAQMVETIAHDALIPTAVHGHDFVDLLRAYLIGVGMNRQLVKEDLLRRAMFACLRPEVAAKDPLLRRLLSAAVAAADDSDQGVAPPGGS